MKKLFFLLITAMTILSCEKDDDRPADNSNGRIEYKVNGQLYIFENIDPLTEYAVMFKQLAGPLSYTRYVINAQKGANAAWVADLKTDSLTTGPFVVDSTNNLNSSNTIKHGGNQSVIYFSGDNLTFNITSHTNGRVSGTFTGMLSPLSPLDYSTRGSVLITEGKLENVLVSY